ncbi:MAG: RNA polymerase sigma factor [Verrucomicrobia bacterium]|nr:RNA polymerase sigma factor [Verrucomicrobiota bacterium]
MSAHDVQTSFAMELLTDNYLMLKVRDGEIEKLGILFERYRTLLLNFFIRCTGNHAWSEDLVQDVFVRILKYRHTFGPESEFAGWMYRIARNTHSKQWRKRGRELQLREEEVLHQIPCEDPGPDAVLERRQAVRLLYHALDTLPPEKRELLVLSRFHRLEYRQIAERLHCDVGAVKVRVFRATREMRKKLLELVGECKRPPQALGTF